MSGTSTHSRFGVWWELYFRHQGKLCEHFNVWCSGCVGGPSSIPYVLKHDWCERPREEDLHKCTRVVKKKNTTDKQDTKDRPALDSEVTRTMFISWPEYLPRKKTHTQHSHPDLTKVYHVYHNDAAGSKELSTSVTAYTPRSTQQLRIDRMSFAMRRRYGRHAYASRVFSSHDEPGMLFRSGLTSS